MKLSARILGFAFACFLASSLSAEDRQHILTLIKSKLDQMLFVIS
jgi:hypothetical protein